MNKGILFTLLATGALLTSCTNSLPLTPPLGVSPEDADIFKNAKAGDRASLRTLASYYSKGHGNFPTSIPLFVTCQEKLAELGESDARTTLARVYGIQDYAKKANRQYSLDTAYMWLGKAYKSSKTESDRAYVDETAAMLPDVGKPASTKQESTKQESTKQKSPILSIVH